MLGKSSASLPTKVGGPVTPPSVFAIAHTPDDVFAQLYPLNLTRKNALIEYHTSTLWMERCTFLDI
ncbi:hypothetical protein REMIM1_PE00276 (plasmid) [Rhizobium etli bv. mimosae str. Mim1]|nr:hypothetical protein REMIM1_PE00276 [Rhizobium etli bv. mimosae str. Mim1]